MNPTIVVYCEGPPGDRHDRYIIAAYQRRHANPAARSQWFPLDQWEGKRLRRVEQKGAAPSRSAFSGESRSAWLRYRFPCDVCGFNRVFNEDERNFGGRMFAVFDQIRSGGRAEVPVRELVRQIDRLK